MSTCTRVRVLVQSGGLDAFLVMSAGVFPVGLEIFFPLLGRVRRGDQGTVATRRPALP